MWAIRILTGPQAGEVFKLKPGKNRIGRSDDADIQLSSHGVSKAHLEIELRAGKVYVADLGSSNGTFVNGVRLTKSKVRLGDKIGLSDVLFEVIPQQAMSKNSRRQVTAASSVEEAPTPPVLSQQNRVQDYLNEVVLPGVYSLTEVFEFRTVLFGMAGLFILAITVLSVFPMKQITSESIQTESRRRAQTVARALANANEKVIRSGDLNNFSVEFVLREDGIDDVYIVSKDGAIIAPPERAGLRPKESRFINEIRGQVKEVASAISADQVAAAFPIVSFDPELQQNVPRAYAVVVFNVGSLQFDDGRALSLFIQMLSIAAVLGVVIFFMIFKLVEFPFVRLNQELDRALRDNGDHIQIKIKLGVLQDVLVNLNSALARIGSSSQAVEQAFSEHNREHEIMNLMSLIGYPVIVFDKQLNIIFCNEGFVSHVFSESLTGRNLQEIPDQAMQKNLAALLESAQLASRQVHSDQFEIGGHNWNLHCQAMGSEFFVVIFVPQLQQQGGAA